MNMSRLRDLFKNEGFTIHMHTRRKGLKYVYAAWRDGGKVKQKYFAPQTRAELMTEEQVLEKLVLLKIK